MVHALQLTHRVLHPNGLLINVHDLPIPHVIEVRSPKTVNKAGWLLDREDFDSTRSALNALAQVVDAGQSARIALMLRARMTKLRAAGRD